MTNKPHELKIIAKYLKNEPIKSSDIFVYIDDEIIGTIQDVDRKSVV
jgi:hypothetical protein